MVQSITSSILVKANKNQISISQVWTKILNSPNNSSNLVIWPFKFQQQFMKFVCFPHWKVAKHGIILKYRPKFSYLFVNFSQVAMTNETKIAKWWTDMNK